MLGEVSTRFVKARRWSLVKSAGELLLFGIGKHRTRKLPCSVPTVRVCTCWSWSTRDQHVINTWSTRDLSYYGVYFHGNSTHTYAPYQCAWSNYIDKDYYSYAGCTALHKYNVLAQHYCPLPDLLFSSSRWRGAIPGQQPPRGWLIRHVWRITPRGQAKLGCYCELCQVCCQVCC